VIRLAVWISPLFAWAALVGTPVAVRVTIHADQTVRTIRGGIGASWHAIETELPGKRPGSGAPTLAARGALIQIRREGCVAKKSVNESDRLQNIQ